jgi:tetratricopeptide (TPR) repeat protein
MLGWFNAREATQLGAALADQYAAGVAAPPGSRGGGSARQEAAKVLERLLRTAEQQISSLRLNFYKRAKLANTFKWRLLEKGIEGPVAEEITQTLIMHFGLSRAGSGMAADLSAPSDARPTGKRIAELFARGSACVASKAYTEAIPLLEELLRGKPRHAEALNNLGVAYSKVGRFEEAAQCYARAISANPNYAMAHTNLGNLCRVTGRIEQAERHLRRALKLRATDEAARTGLASLLMLLGNVQEAKGHFEKVLRARPRNAEAVLGLGQVHAMDGNSEEAEKLYRRALEIEPDMPGALGSIVALRRMTPADDALIQRVRELADQVSDPLVEADFRFALGKYHDDLREFDPAFESFRRGNDLLKAAAPRYRREEHAGFLDDLIRVYSREAIAGIGGGASTSSLPVLVVGMPRSGTSLVEQIIASHPLAFGAGELNFWTGAVAAHETDVRRGMLDERLRKKLADDCLRVLSGLAPGAQRVVDKTPVEVERLGLIYSVFPKARFIYTSRNPVDTCLSCYFQQFSGALNFTLDLEDLSYYYRQHHRIVKHWRAVLPPGSLLEVPYEQLVAEPEPWIRRILDFIGLEWDDRCLEFHRTRRVVATASNWQVRQRIYRSSVERWRNYKKFIGPLRQLQNLGD